MSRVDEANLRNDLQCRAEAFTDVATDDFGTIVAAVKAGDESARLDLCAGLLHASFRQPLAIDAVYDELADRWLGGSDSSIQHSAQSQQPPTDSAFTAEFWQALWLLLDDAGGFDASNLTARVAALGGVLDPRYGMLAETHSHSNPGAAHPHTRTPPPMIELETLASAPHDSLARDLHRMLVDNGYDAEVLDRQALGLGALPPGLSYLNTRILQMHDVWHLAAGYRTTSLHEIAISAFQLAQFGHNYSAMFLAVVTTLASTTRPEGLPILLQIVSEAWRHGRKSPAFMAIEWEQEWHKPLQVVRTEQGIEPFTSALPADLFETLAQASAN